MVVFTFFFIPLSSWLSQANSHVSTKLLNWLKGWVEGANLSGQFFRRCCSTLLPCLGADGWWRIYDLSFQACGGQRLVLEMRNHLPTLALVTSLCCFAWCLFFYEVAGVEIGKTCAILHNYSVAYGICLCFHGGVIESKILPNSWHVG